MIPRYEGKRLEYFRKKRGLTQGELAWEARVSRRSLNRWETRGIPYRWLCVGRVCNVLEIDSKELASREVRWAHQLILLRFENFLFSRAEELPWKDRIFVLCWFSRETLRWEYFWKCGFFGVPENPEAPRHKWKAQPRLKVNTGARVDADEYSTPAEIEVLRKIEPMIYDDKISTRELLKLAA